MNKRLAVAFVGVFLATLLSAPARADVMAGLGASGNFGVANRTVRLPDSWSVDGMAGYRFSLGVLELTPEMGLSYVRSTGTLRGLDVDWAFQASVGARVAVRIRSVVPSVYGRVGLGLLEVTSVDLLRHAKTGPYYEVGGALDFRLGGDVSLGLQVGYGAVSLTDVEAGLKSAQINGLRAGIRLLFFI